MQSSRFVALFLVCVVVFVVFSGTNLYQKDPYFQAAVETVSESLQSGVLGFGEVFNAAPKVILAYGAALLSRSLPPIWEEYRYDPYLLGVIPEGECGEVSQELGWGLAIPLFVTEIRSILPSLLR